MLPNFQAHCPGDMALDPAHQFYLYSACEPGSNLLASLFQEEEGKDDCDTLDLYQQSLGELLVMLAGESWPAVGSSSSRDWHCQEGPGTGGTLPDNRLCTFLMCPVHFLQQSLRGGGESCFTPRYSGRLVPSPLRKGFSNRPMIWPLPGVSDLPSSRAQMSDTSAPKATEGSVPVANLGVGGSLPRGASEVLLPGATFRQVVDSGVRSCMDLWGWARSGAQSNPEAGQAEESLCQQEPGQEREQRALL